MVAITIHGWTFRMTKAGLVLAATKPGAPAIDYRPRKPADMGMTGGEVEEIRIHLARLNACFRDQTLGVPVSEPMVKEMEDAAELL